MYIYAVLDENNICTGSSNLSGPVDKPNMIQIPKWDNDLLWRKYEYKQWSDGKFPPVTVPEPSLVDMVAQLQSDNLILMDAVATLYEKLRNAGVIS